MAELNITIRQPEEFTVNGEKYAIKPLPAGVGFKLTYLLEDVAKFEKKDTVSAAQLADKELKLCDTLAEVFANNAVDPEKTRAIFAALKENDGMTWMHLLMNLTKKLLA